MRGITIPILALLAPVVISILRRPLRNLGIGPSIGFYLAIGITWVGLVLSYYLDYRILEGRIDSFDTNGDGMINPGEMTKEAQGATDQYANDSPISSDYAIFSLFGSVIWCSLVFSVSHFAIWLIGLLRRQLA